MLKLVTFSIAISLVSAQNYKQIQTFAAPATQQEVHSQPQIHSQPQSNPSIINDEAARNYRQSIAQSIRDSLAKQVPSSVESFPANFPVESLNDPNIPVVEINNQPAIRQPHVARPRPRPQRIRVQEQFTEEEEEENIPQQMRQQRLRNPVPNTQVRQHAVRSEEEDAETARYLRKQAENAQYSFDSSVTDTINDQAISRQETRDGLALKGMYSYSDGYFRRTVHYEADENGYRVTKEEIDPIGDGPQYNPSGKADVSSSLIGGYSITADDVRDTRVKEPLRRQELNEPEVRFNKAPERKHRFEAGRV